MGTASGGDKLPWGAAMGPTSMEAGGQVPNNTNSITEGGPTEAMRDLSS